MIASLVRWLRLTLPPAWAVIVAIVMLSSCEGLYFWLRHRLNWPDVAHDALGPLLEMRDHFAVVIAVAYGIFRVAAFHPFFRPKYRGWLEQTPWTSHKPLPLGPIHLVAQDVLVVGVLLLSLHGTPLGRVWTLGAFLLAYLGTLGMSFWFTGPWWMGYIVIFGLGLAVRLTAWPLVYIGVLMVVYAIAVMGCGMALARFPWQESVLMESLSRQLRNNSPARRRSLLGWPNGQLSGVRPNRKVRRRDGVLGPLLAVWWMYSLTSMIREADDRSAFLLVVLSYITCLAVLIRLVTYIAPCRPPINFWGRIVTGRWIIPGYDCVFVAPLCALFIVVAVIVAGHFARPAHCDGDVYLLAIATVLLITLNMGPSLERWHLTGHHRIVPWSGNATALVKL